MRLILGCIIAIVGVIFALSNRQLIDLHLWPTDFALQAPLSLTMLVAMGIAFFLGALVTWSASLGQRRRARRAEDTVRLLESQVTALKRSQPVASRFAKVDA